MCRLFCCALATIAAALSLDVSAQLPRLLPGTGPEAFATIGGSALDSVNAPLADANVRLRDARSGRSMEILRTDRDGLFTFRPVDPGSYVVEILTESQTSVLAASQVLNVEAAQVASVTVKLPFRVPGLTRLLGPSTAGAIAAEAALAGIMLIHIAGTATCDTLQ
jgi:Carboxypeptidase regulatory-like domain